MESQSPKSFFHPRPAPLNGGFRMEGYWVWCPSVVQDGKGLWHLFASRWPKKWPMHPGWMFASEVVRATSDKPEGPFTFQGVVFPARGAGWWDGRSTHNPRVHTVVENGKTRYLLFYVGSTHPFPDPPADVKLTDPVPVVARSNKRVGVAVADDPAGPWERLDHPILPTRSGHFDDFLTSNPAAAIRPDGSVYLMYKARTYLGPDKNHGHGPMSLGAAVAPHWRGPYRRLTDKPLFSPDHFGEVEDPFVWDEGGRLHLIAKDMTGKVCGEHHGGLHAVSDDGIDWRLADPPLAYSRRVTWDNGEVQTLGSFERPFVLFQNGKATHLLGASADGPGGFGQAKTTWDVVIPLG